MVNSAVGYIGEPDGSGPPVGVPYSAHIFVGVDNPGTGVVRAVQYGVFLPPFTRFASGGPIRCFLTPSPGEVTSDPVAQCIQQPLQLANGMWHLGIRDIPMYYVFEQVFTLVSTAAIADRLVASVTTYLGEAQPQVPIRIADNPAAPPPRPSQGKLVFVRNPPFASIQTMNYNGTGLVEVLSEGYAGEPAWSPDRSRIAFVSYRDGRAQIYVMNADGSNQRRVTADPPLRDMTCGSPRWSLDGSLLLLSASRPNDTWQIFTVGANGANQRQLTFDSAVPKTNAVWVPRTRRIAFLGNNDIYRMDYDGQTRERLTFDGSIVTRWELASHPFHEWLAYTTKVPGPGDRWEIHLWAGGGSFRIAEGQNPTWSPDGLWVAYTKREQAASGGITGSLFMSDYLGRRETLIERPALYNWDTQADWSLQ